MTTADPERCPGQPPAPESEFLNSLMNHWYRLTFDERRRIVIICAEILRLHAMTPPTASAVEVGYVLGRLDALDPGFAPKPETVKASTEETDA